LLLLLLRPSLRNLILLLLLRVLLRWCTLLHAACVITAGEVITACLILWLVCVACSSSSSGACLFLSAGLCSRPQLLCLHLCV
jgi:hypothetical protein